MPDFLDRILKTLQTRQSLENPSTSLSNPAPWLFDALGAGPPGESGVRVNQNSAMGLTGFWACVKIIAETVGSLPLHVYRELDANGDKEKATDRYEYRVLHDEFNSVMTSLVAREVGQAHLLTWGNAYYLKRYNGAAKVESLWPLQPGRTRPTTTAGNLVYETTDTPDGKMRDYDAEDVVHVPGLSFDGINGLSVLKFHRETIGHGIATERYGAAYFGKGGKPLGTLQVPELLTDEAYARLQASWKQQTVDGQTTPILEQGTKYEAISVPPEDSQYIETRAFNVADMARIFRIPLAMLQVQDKAAAYASVEQFFLQFAVHTIRPWLVRWEQELNRKVLGLNSGLYAEFSMDALLRGDLKSRYDAYHLSISDGWQTWNDVLAKENMNLVSAEAGGDTHWVPANMMPADRALNPPKPAPAPVPNTEQNPPQQARTEHGPNGKELHGGANA